MLEAWGGFFKPYLLFGDIKQGIADWRVWFCEWYEGRNNVLGLYPMF